MFGLEAMAILVFVAMLALAGAVLFYGGPLVHGIWRDSAMRTRVAYTVMAAGLTLAVGYWLPGLIVVGLAIASCLGLLTLMGRWAMTPSRRDLDREFATAAAELGLGLSSPGIRVGGGLVAGLPVSVEARHSFTRVAVTVELGGLSAEAGPPHAGEEQVGDPLLDGLVRFTGKAPKLLAALDPMTRGQLADAVLLRGVLIRKGLLFVEKPGVLYPAEALVQLVRASVDLAATLAAAFHREELAALIERATHDPLPMVRLGALVALDGRDPATARAALEDPLPTLRAAGAMTLGGEALDTARADSAIEPVLLALLSSGSPALRVFAVRALGELGTLAALAPLARAADSPAALARLRQRHPAGNAQLSLSEAGEDLGAVSLAAQPGAVAFAKARGEG